MRETGKSVPEIARNLGILSRLRNRVNKDKVECGEAEGPSSDERAALARSRSENAELRFDNAAAESFFSTLEHKALSTSAIGNKAALLHGHG